jgi:hypothetical protein
MDLLVGNLFYSQVMSINSTCESPINLDIAIDSLVIRMEGVIATVNLYPVRRQE